MSTIKSLIEKIIARIDQQIAESLKGSPDSYGEQCHRRALREAVIIILQEEKKQHPSMEATPAQLPKEPVSESKNTLIDKLRSAKYTGDIGNAGLAHNHALDKAMDIIQQHESSVQIENDRVCPATKYIWNLEVHIFIQEQNQCRGSYDR